MVVFSFFLCYAPFEAVRTVETLDGNRVLATCPRFSPVRGSVNGVILILIGKSTDRFVSDMLPRLEAYFLKNYSYPVHIFHENLSDDVRLAITAAIPSAYRVELEDVSRFWNTLPDGISEDQLRTWMSTGSQRKTQGRGYRIMCRFWAGLVWQLPSLDAYDYYWRLDDDSFLTTYVPCDVFQVMQLHQCSYGYMYIKKDPPSVTKDLWTTFQRWAYSTLTQEEISVITDKFVTGNETLGKKKFRAFMYYNNFEIGTIALKRHLLYTSMFRFLDEEEPRGIMQYRWGDAPIHTLGVEVVMHRMGWKKCKFPDAFGGYIHKPRKPLPVLPRREVK
ncbi:alpha-1,2-mannosyltransferase [Trypanosoma theileri]|uniref:Alpha-1,2-mannosyltransferase n=1 Tax=Trypanosoma theileri TaxID=67003 RepID=A0A1X0NM65_9TRYP|nr:alpha-1,2-mannosyltransferase [Trypanosoma theileri]ORC85815.1 alpha-1,2-mannosyltransferase [Trypanosoma theileri]